MNLHLGLLAQVAERAVIPLLVTTSVMLVLTYATEDPPPIEVLLPAAPTPSPGPLLDLPSANPSAEFSPFPVRDGGPRNATPSPFPTPTSSLPVPIPRPSVSIPSIPPLPTVPPLPTPPLCEPLCLLPSLLPCLVCE